MSESVPFGKLNRRETPQAEERNFEKDRPMYERLNDHVLDDLLTRWDAITAHQRIEQGIIEDVRQKSLIEQQLREHFEKIKKK